MSSHFILDGKSVEYNENTVFTIQLGRNAKGSYRAKYTFIGDFKKANFYFQGINIGNGYKKRLVMDGKVISRQFSY